MNYKEIIESRYNRQNWQTLLHDIFGGKVKFWSAPYEIDTNSNLSKQTLWLGTITLTDGETISIYEVELAESVDIERNRRGIRDMLLTDWRTNGSAGAFMFCYRKNESVLRFSYVSESWNFAEDGTYKKESTDTKRFTYLLGEGHRSRTAIQQFEKLRDSSQTLKDLTKAFSVDAVSDMFFKGYKQQYEDIIFYVTGKRMVKVANKWEERQEGKPCGSILQQFSHFANPEKAVRDYVKKLMGRLVFLQFLQKKGWLGVPANAAWGEGDAEFIQNLFAQCQDKDHFVDNVLEPLFNDLNTEREGDFSKLLTLNSRPIKVPYLNGGLFECEATDETNFPLPAKYMKSLLDFFASYNFTIDENDPDDAEVGVDPEMLGRIFENLLEDNKDKGAFYTPKEIVCYMCRESLIAYLQTDIEDESTQEAIRQFVTTHDVAALGTNDKFRQQVDEALKNVKICDPAIGSGAFPMGLLKELFLCRTVLEGISQHQAAAIKKHIIQQNIYGVDIERGAVDIARLRFWLSLIVDEETPQALPNLDFKIMQGNSLLEQYKGVDFSKITELKSEKEEGVQLSWFEEALDVLRLDLRKKLDEYYNCTDHHEKQALRKDIINNVKQQLREQSININFGDLDLSGNNQFFLWHTWFYDVFSQGGFDIVIGNPPYVRRTSLPDEDKHRYEKIYTSATKQYDLYLLFIEKGLKTLAINGSLCYINPIRFFNSDYGQGCRKYIVKNHKLKAILDVSQIPVFRNAMTYPCVLMLQEGKDTNNNNDILYRRLFDLKNLQVIDKVTPIFTKQKEIETDREFRFIVDVKPELRLLIEKIDSKGHPISSLFDIARGLANSKVDFEGRMYQALKSTNVRRYFIEGEPKRINTDYAYIFKYPMIILPRTVEYLQAMIKEENIICLDRIYYLTPKVKMNLLYALGIINSSLTNFWFEYYYKTTKVSGNFFDLNGNQIGSIPIPFASSSQQQPIINWVNQILSAKKENPSADTSSLESEIDCLVYQLYGLTEEEIKIVDGEY